MTWLQRRAVWSLWWLALSLVNVALGILALAWLSLAYGGAFNG